MVNWSYAGKTELGASLDGLYNYSCWCMSVLQDIHRVPDGKLESDVV